MGGSYGWGSGGFSSLFLLSVGLIDSLHQSTASQQASQRGGGGSRGVNWTPNESMGDGQRVSGWGGEGKRLEWLSWVLTETGERGKTISFPWKHTSAQTDAHECTHTHSLVFHELWGLHTDITPYFNPNHLILNLTLTLTWHKLNSNPKQNLKPQNIPSLIADLKNVPTTTKCPKKTKLLSPQV